MRLFISGFFISSLLLVLGGCTTSSVNTASGDVPVEDMPVAVAPAEGSPPTSSNNNCEGTTALPAELAGSFDPVDDPELLKGALGDPGKGGLCKAAVYQLKPGAQVDVYRVWNSTYQKSENGRWWAFSRPQGSITTFRENYEICIEWSPLDRLRKCRLTAGTRVAVGPGQSASCPQSRVEYGVSAAQQVYLEDAAQHVEDCEGWEADFSWQ